MLFNNVNNGYRTAILKKNSLRLLPFYMAVTTYSCDEKVCETMLTAVVSHLLNSILSSKRCKKENLKEFLQ